MESSDAVDPYEQQLRAVFDSFDADQAGSLDSSGLQLLCEQLPLDPCQSSDLIHALIQHTSSRVTFSQFRDGLLALLGGGLGTSSAQATTNKVKAEQSSPTRGDSPEREVSPKLVLGQKKYGRRSRPESADHDDILCDDMDSPSSVFIDDKKNSEVIQKLSEKAIFGNEDVGDGDSHNAKKRRTVSSPDKYSKDMPVSQLGSTLSGPPGSLSQVEECLGLAWQQFGQNGFVNQVELEQVCECIGIEKLSQEAIQQLFDQLDADRDGKISLDEFLHLFRSGVSLRQTSSLPPSIGWASCASSVQGNHSGGITLNIVDCNGIGLASSEAIVEMWETVGVSNPLLILRDLNLDDSSRPINVSLLANTLEEEIRQAKAENASESPASSTQPEPNVFTNNLLLAALSLRQVELRWVRSSMEQMMCERDKLKNDLGEANQRANLLAQEIDEHHSKLEKVSQNQVKLLEQKHSESMRDLSMRLGQEREHLVQQNNRLEQKVAALQQCESKLTSEMASLKLEYETLDQESRVLNERLSECEETNKKMENDLQEMENLQQRFNELQANQEPDKIEHLLDQLGKLRSENSSLRDRNDELTVELEVLTSRLASLKVRRQSVLVDGAGGGGTKRRGNPALPRTPTEDSGDEESPRVGKVRRRSHKGEISLDAVHIEGLQIHPLHNESGPEADLDIDPENVTGSAGGLGNRNLVMGSDHWLDLSSENSSLGGSQDDLLNLGNNRFIGAPDKLVAHLQARVKELEQALQLHGSNIMNNQDRTADLQSLREAEEGAVLMCDEGIPTSSSDVLCFEWIERSTSDPKESPAPMHGTSSGQAVEQLQQHCRDLESQLDTVKIEIVKILSEKRACSQENCILKKRIVDLRNQLPDTGDNVDSIILKKEDFNSSHASDCNQLPNSFSQPSESRQQLDKEDNTIFNSKLLSSEDLASKETIDELKTLEESRASIVATLTDRCSELEKSLAMMRDEYERCEDYWAGKLDEERQLAEQEQRITDEKFAELVSKIREYEELLADDHSRRSGNLNDGRLETIEEQDGLEKQVTELEEELEDIRHQASEQIADKEREILHLQEQLQLLQNCYKSVNGCSDVAIQVSDPETGSWGSDRTFIVKPRRGVGDKTESQSSQSLFNGATSENTQSSPTSSMSDSPVLRSDEDTRDSHSGAMRHHHRKIRHHPRYAALNCLNPQDELQAFGLRLQEQEQACIRLQRALRVQQQQAQTILQHTWDRHKQELADMQAVLQCTQEKLQQQVDVNRDQMNKLTKSDILVKELYVENAHLLQSIQSLEQRYQVLSQQQIRISSGDSCSSV